MNNAEYIKDKLNEINLKWNEKYINDIQSNGIECWWTIGELGSLKRFYKVVPFNECDERGLVLSENPKYFVLYEALGIESEKATPVAIYENFKSAQNRAKFQLLVVSNIIKCYCQ